MRAPAGRVRRAGGQHRRAGAGALGTLRINAPVSWGIARLGPLLASYRERFPQVELDLALSDRLVDMVEEGYDVAIRITREPGPT
jgi:DNA-binding transcriptional LysR family regulator